METFHNLHFHSFLVERSFIYSSVDINGYVICFEVEENMFLYPIEHISDQGNAQRTKSLRFIFPYSSKARKAFQITRNIYTKLQCIPMHVRADLCADINVTKIWLTTWFLLVKVEFIGDRSHLIRAPHALGQWSPKSTKNGILPQLSPQSPSKKSLPPLTVG